MILAASDVQCRFLGVDTLWALCMGFNVYLALFRGWTSERMRRQEVIHFSEPSFLFLFFMPTSKCENADFEIW